MSTGVSRGQARANHSLRPLGPSSVGAREPSGKTRRPPMEAALVVPFGLVRQANRREPLSDDLV